MAPKRKASSSLTSTKQKKTTKKDESILSLEQIQQLGDQIIASSKHYNNFVQLLEQYEYIKRELTNREDEEIETIGRQLSITLYKCFEKLLREQVMINKKSHSENKRMVTKWLLNKYDTFKSIINRFIIDKLAVETSLQVDLLEIGLNLVKLESEFMKSGENDLYFPTLTYKGIVEAMLLSENGEIDSNGSTENFIILEFIDKFKKYWDLQFYFVNNLHEILNTWKETKNQEQLRVIFGNFYTIFKNKLLFTPDTEELEEQRTWIKRKLPSIAYKISQFKTQYQKAFIAVLSYPLLTSQYKSILLILHKRIIPYMAQPQSLMDFLTDSYNVGDDGVVPVLALNSLYELMKRYNLEYPDFYMKLYSLLTPSLLYTRYRSRFFRLCDLFLSSTHLSASLIASFIKKLARLSITSSASGVVIVIPFIYNLLKRHPSCMVMLHNPNVAASQYVDPFDNEEVDPLKTGAMGSSLWELEALMSHYHPNIATLAKIFGEPFKKLSYNLEDFLDWSYISLLESEKNRKYKTHVALEFEERDYLFDSKDRPESSTVYAKGWSL